MFKLVNNVCITGMSHEGQGITHVSDRICFVQGALENEIVDIRVTRKRKGVLYAEVVNVIRPSSMRISAKCAVYDYCGGCNLQHCSTQHQLKLKQEPFLEQVQSKLGYLPDIIHEPIVHDAWHYRRKARLSVRYVAKKEKILIGFRERSTNWVVDTNECPILPKRVMVYMNELAILLADMSIRSDIPQLELACGDEVDCIVIRHLSPLSTADKEQLITFAKTHQIWLMTQAKHPYDSLKLWPDDEQYYLTYDLKDQNLRYCFHPHDFIQVNAHVNQSCVNLMLEWACLSRNDMVLDLFCGLGNFTLPMALHAHSVHGYELSDEMVTRARHNANLNQLDNVTFYATDLDAIDHDKWLHHSHYDVVLIDPPRSGAKAVIPTLLRIQPKTIIYISCHWPSMLRDLELLSPVYKVEKLCCMDMFPQTYHIETMVKLVKQDS